MTEKALREQIAELKRVIQGKDSQVANLGAQVVSLTRADLDRNAIQEQIYSLQKGLSERQDALQRCRADKDKLARENDTLRHSLTLCPRLADPELMCVRPHWTGRVPAVDDRLCFLIMPFAQPWSDRVWLALERAISSCALKSLRADQQPGRMVVQELWKGICEAGTVIADLTGGNPNVCYELGLADVLGRRLILVSQTTDPSKIPFDFLGHRFIEYDDSSSGLEKLRDDVRDRLK